jgi:hypothetical protein
MRDTEWRRATFAVAPNAVLIMGALVAASRAQGDAQLVCWVVAGPRQLRVAASPSTTSGYDRRGDKARRSAAERLSLDLGALPEELTNNDGR